jgi:serine/threonine-protein kinase
VLRKLGEGGMGQVFLAEHGLLGRRAAIKVLHAERSAQREDVERFFNEARATSAVSDPGIVQVLDFGIAPDQTAYIVMEFLEGEQLNHRLHRLRALQPVDALRIVRQVAGSLAAAHAAGIVHRDLKPENLFMVREPEAPGGERAKILDFGIAKLGADIQDRFKTRTGAVMGTPVYMSPEQCNDSSKTDHRTDIYSLGCVLFHLLTGEPPFDLDGVGAIISAHLREPAPRPSSIASHLPPAIDELVLRCLAKSPDERFSSMTELQRACDAVLAHVSALSAPTLAVPSQLLSAPGPLTMPLESRTTLGNSAGQPSRELPKPRRMLWLGAAAIAIAVGAGAAALTARAGREVQPPAASVENAPVAMPPAVPAGDAQVVTQVVDAAPTVPTVAAPTAADPAPVEAAAETQAPPDRTQKPKSHAPAKAQKSTKTSSKKTDKREDLYEDRN